MTCRKVSGEKVTVEEGGTRGQEKRVDATGGKTNGRKEVRVDVTKRKSITRTMIEKERKEQQRKRKGKIQQPGRCKTEELL
ncbi:hypothetical protein NP493_1370g01007 [Ridgeia piscesae]|uniref:Uncharacterized protein n=1 Tax=Ridgeia piscesae TaxID=27915 RepID=A0AAD9K6B9_RIDPI|nr:hypothetical protein NP493_1370g01007 [Ridgeia piscesae]